VFYPCLITCGSDGTIWFHANAIISAGSRDNGIVVVMEPDHSITTTSKQAEV
jgi:hypothetical protein